MFYKAIGFLVWKGARFYVSARCSRGRPSRKLLVGGAMALAVATLVAVGNKRNDD